jgi:hypothetical protein
MWWWMIAMCIPPNASAVPSPRRRAKHVTRCCELIWLGESRSGGGYFLSNLPKILPTVGAHGEITPADFPAG